MKNLEIEERPAGQAKQPPPAPAPLAQGLDPALVRDLISQDIRKVFWLWVRWKLVSSLPGYETTSVKQTTNIAINMTLTTAKHSYFTLRSCRLSKVTSTFYLDCEKMAAYAKEERHIKEENIRLQRKLLREMERREALSRQLSESESSLEMDDER